jgi:HD-GYP domain-containing protein (c-di-GMP phosphodiesterase class II)
MTLDVDGESPEYIGIPRQFISPDAVTGVHLYLNVGGRFVLYRSGHEPVDAESLEKLKHRDIETLYVSAAQAEQLDSYVANHIGDVVRAAKTPQEKARYLRDATRAVLRGTLGRIESPGDLKRVQGVSDTLAETISNNASLLSDVVRFAEGNEQLFVHSANVAAYAIVLAARRDEFTDKDLSAIGVGALVHDVGLATVEPALLTKPDEMRTDMERHFLARHPRRGAVSLEQAGIDNAIVVDIVRNHHGGGEGGRLTLPTQIVQLADVFDSLTSRPRHNTPQGPYAALYEMRHRMGERFSPELIREFVLTLGGITDVSPDSPVAPLSRRRQPPAADAA